METLQMSDEIIKVFEYLGGKFGIAIDWTNSNVIPYLQQLFEKFIKWEIATSITWIVIVAIIAIIFVGLGLIVNDSDFWILPTIAIVIALVIISFQAFDIITANYFPEKALYDYLNMNGII